MHKYNFITINFTSFFLLENPVIYLNYLINKALYIFCVLYKY